MILPPDRPLPDIVTPRGNIIPLFKKELRTQFDELQPESQKRMLEQWDQHLHDEACALASIYLAQKAKFVAEAAAKAKNTTA